MVLVTALWAVIWAIPVWAASDTVAPGISEVDATRLVEGYLNGLHTMRSGFQQVVKGQGVAAGTFYLKKPGRFLWVYNYPGQERLIFTGKNLYFYEEDSQQTTELPRNTPMVKLLGAARVSLKEAGFKVDKASRHDGRLSVTLGLHEQEADLSTAVTLVFVEKPQLRLEKFISTNQLNQRVEVSLFGYEENVVLPDNLFQFTPTVQKNSHEAF